jgi:hypothetical protein
MPVYSQDLFSREHAAALNTIHTPDGGFATVAAVATWYGLSFSAVVFRLRSPAFPDWTSQAFPKLRTGVATQGIGQSVHRDARRIRCQMCGEWFDSYGPNDRLCSDCPGGEAGSESGHW